MMGKTHISVGIATAFLVTQPTSPGEFAVAVVGGSVGGILPDLEVRSNPKFRDALYARYIVLALVLMSLIVDLVVQGPMISSVVQNTYPRIIGGGVLFLAAVLFGRRTSHRTFTHSLLGLLLFCGGVALVCPPLTAAFAAGFVSHVLLDLLNKKPIQIFYPIKKGKFCLKLCYANRVANTVFFFLGLVGILFWVGNVALT